MPPGRPAQEPCGVQAGVWAGAAWHPAKGSLHNSSKTMGLGSTLLCPSSEVGSRWPSGLACLHPDGAPTQQDCGEKTLSKGEALLRTCCVTLRRPANIPGLTLSSAGRKGPEVSHFTPTLKPRRQHRPFTGLFRHIPELWRAQGCVLQPLPLRSQKHLLHT